VRFCSRTVRHAWCSFDMLVPVHHTSAFSEHGLSLGRSITYLDPAPFAYQASFSRLAMRFPRFVIVNTATGSWTLREREDLKRSFSSVGHIRCRCDRLKGVDATEE
jgi:hypothetical protein